MKSLTPPSYAAIAIFASAAILSPRAVTADTFPYAKPISRFEPFSKLSTVGQVVAETKLGYMEVTWNNHGIAPIEKKSWSSFTSNERDGASELGFSQGTWDCFINHYEQYSWDGLATVGAQKHFADLGWTQAHWEHTADTVPYTESKWWGQLTAEEKKSANSLCYFKDNWDKIDMNPNPTFFPHAVPEFRYTPWDELDAVTKNVIVGMMNYTQELWDNLGESTLEKNTFLNLDALEREGALELGFYTHTWDCFMNHYASYYWSSFQEDLEVAIKTLGWTEGIWTSTEGLVPDSENKIWIDLTSEEKAAATRLCYFKETWDGEAITDFYNYETGESAANVSDGPLPKDIDLDIFAVTGYVGKEPGSVGLDAYTSAEPGSLSSSSYRALVSWNALALVLSIGVALFV